jgi:citrate synthase
MGELVDARTAAQRLGIDIRTLYAYVSRGSLRRVHGPDGRSSRYDSDDLELLARRSRPRTLPRPAASIDLVIATRVSTVTDGMVRYRDKDVLDLVAAGEPFERVADLLWQGDGGDWPGPDPADGPVPRMLTGLGSDIPALHRFAITVATLPGPGDDKGPPVPDWPAWGRRIVGCLTGASGASGASGAAPSPWPARSAPRAAAAREAVPTLLTARRLWERWSPLRPTATRVGALNTALVLLAEHELALSTLAVRVAASARAAPAACILAGLSTMTGDLHGAAAPAVHRALMTGEPVTRGFGHVLHRHGDPRAAPLLDAVRGFATERDWGLIEQTRRGLPHHPNVDFPLGALTYAARMPPEAGSALFAIARVAGWIAHAAEEHAERPLRFRGHAFRTDRGRYRQR